MLQNVHDVENSMSGSPPIASMIARRREISADMAPSVSCFRCLDFRAAAVFFFLLAVSLSSSESMTMSGSSLRGFWFAFVIPADREAFRSWTIGGLPGDDFCLTMGDALTAGCAGW